MEFSIKLHPWSIVYIERSQVIISKKRIVILSLKIEVDFTNSVDPDEMLHNAVFNLGLHCLLNFLFRGFCSSKGLSITITGFVVLPLYYIQKFSSKWVKYMLEL